MANHDVEIRGEVVEKRYTRTDRGEPTREWVALTLLAEHSPGLAPRPIARESDPPVVLMSRVEGEPLHSVLTPDQTAAMVAAYRTLFAVPVPPDLPQRQRTPGDFVRDNVARIEQVRGRTDLPLVVRHSLDAARAWHADPPAGIGEVRDPVLAQGDAKVDNMLWDGVRFRLVDFEGSGVGDLAFEVADLAEHISTRLDSLRDPEAVIDGFDLDATRRERVAAYRIVLATMWLLEVLPGGRGAALNPGDSATRQAVHLLGLLEASGGSSASSPPEARW